MEIILEDFLPIPYPATKKVFTTKNVPSSLLYSLLLLSSYSSFKFKSLYIQNSCGDDDTLSTKNNIPFFCILFKKHSLTQKSRK